MPDRHKTDPKAVRMPGGLLAWYEQHAADTGRRVNTVLVAALEEYRARHDGATTPRRPRRQKAAPAVTFTAPLDSPNARIAFGVDPDCPHPKARINKGLCGACGTNVGTSGGK